MTITVTESTAEWAVKVTRHDGTVDYEIHSSEFWARIIADGVYSGGTLTAVHREPGGDWQVAS